MLTRASAIAARRRRVLLDGFITGLAAPVLLIAGRFDSPIEVRRSSVEGSWLRVGSYLRGAMRSEALDERHRDG